MGKALLLLSCLSLVILAIGTAFDHSSQLFLLASDSSSYQYIREILASLLFFQFITHPPRHLAFRLLAGLVALTVSAWALVSTYQGVMPFLDTFSLLASASAIGVTALEVNTSELRTARNARNANPSNPMIA